MKKVDFMIPGAMKCGTSTLSEILRAHPAIDFSTPKEPHFFSRATNWKNELDRYESYFNRSASALRGEGSTSYTMYPWFNHAIWNDIHAYNPDMKFIYLVRNPVDRFISHYMHIYKRGMTKDTLADSLKKAPLIMHTGRYYTQIFPYVQKFGRDNVLILDFDDLIRRTADTVRVVAEFLGVAYDDFQDFESIHKNPSIGRRKQHGDGSERKGLKEMVKTILPRVWRKGLNGKPTKTFDMKPELSLAHREMVLNMLALDIQALEKLMNKDLGHWMTHHELK